MGSVRYVGVPAPMLREILTSGPGWRAMGERIKVRAREKCPKGEEKDGWVGPHLADTIEARFIGGPDARILIGSKSPKLGWLLSGTDPHPIDPVNATVLRFTVAGGTVVFARHVDHPGTKPATEPNFLMRAMQEIVRGA